MAPLPKIRLNEQKCIPFVLVSKFLPKTIKLFKGKFL